jgi:hypothetical protein
METSYLLVRLPAHAVNRTKRLIKVPKIYWVDTGLALYLAEAEQPDGAHLENLVLYDLLTWRDARVERAELDYWRTSIGEEVDFVIEAGRQAAADRSEVNDASSALRSHAPAFVSHRVWQEGSRRAASAMFVPALEKCQESDDSSRVNVCKSLRLCMGGREHEVVSHDRWRKDNAAAGLWACRLYARRERHRGAGQLQDLAPRSRSIWWRSPQRYDGNCPRSVCSTRPAGRRS